MKLKTLKTLAIFAILAGTLTISAHAASIGGATAQIADLNFRRSPSLSSRVYTTVPQDTVVVVGEKIDDSWYKVVYDGAVGYMAAEHLTFSETLDGDFGGGTVRAESVRMRAEPDITSGIVGTYGRGIEMTVLGVSGSWYKVSCNGAEGYIHSDNFSLNNGTSDLYDAIGSSETGQLIVDTAMQYIGVPYVWAGTSPSGFDCSGFVHYVYKECGYTINRTAALIFQNGEAIDKEDLLPGNVVCFSSSSNYLGHVGIYIGDGQFIHASSGAGSVIISELSDSYYTKNYVGSRTIA